MRKLLLLATAIVLFAGCANEELTNVNDEPINNQMIITIEKSPIVNGEVGDGTTLRSTVSETVDPTIFHIHWKNGDMVGIRRIDPNNGNLGGPNQNHPFKFIDGDYSTYISQGSFQNESANTITAGNYIAYYPYSTAGLVGGGMQFDLSCQIDDGSFSNFGSYDFMYSEQFPIAKNENGIDAIFNREYWENQAGFGFKHAMAFLRIKITGLDPGEIVYQIQVVGPFKRSVKIKSNNNPVEYINPTPSMVLFTRENGENGYTTSDGSYSGLLVVAPGIEAGTQLKIICRTSKGRYESKDHYIVGSTNGGKPITAQSFYTGLSRGKDDMTFSADDKWDGLSGTYSLPYIDDTNILIRTPYELAWVAGVCNREITGAEMGGISNANFENYIITLAKDIDLNQKNWTPIGTVIGRAFAGTFDGNGNKIIGLKVTGSNAGLFGFTSEKAVIKKVTFNSPSISGGPNIGAIVAQNGGHIEGCNINNGSINGADGNNTGCIVGTNTSSGVISDCTVSFTTGTRKGTANVGGVVGKNEGTVENCSAKNGTQTVVGTGANIGGIVGNNTGEIVNCKNTFKVTGHNYVGGIAGLNAGNIKDCVNDAGGNGQAQLTGTASYVGGIAGKNNGNITNCTSTFTPLFN